MFYTVYKITNLINNKIYVGCHITKNLDDLYFGSGLHIQRSILKYGIGNFKKEYIQIFDNPVDMYNLERVIVNTDFANSKNTYNIKEGGNGGWLYLNRTGKNNSDSHRKQFTGIVKAKWKDVEFSNRMKKILSDTAKLSHKLGKIKYDNFTGKHHTDEAKRKISLKNSIHQKGENNSCFSRIWLYSLELQCNKFINHEEKEKYLNEGWILGRRMKFNSMSSKGRT